MNNDSISSVVSTLYQIKEEFPYLRLGQIMSNFNDYMKCEDVDPFYLKDNKLSEYFECFYDELCFGKECSETAYMPEWISIEEQMEAEK